MKKILIFFITLITLFMLTSCGKQNFNDLPKEKQVKIQEEIQKEFLVPFFQDIMKLTFSNLNLSKEEQERQIKVETDKMKENLKKYLNDKYPNINFNIDEIGKIDNSRKEILDETEKKKEFKSIKLGEYGEFSKGKDELIKIKVTDIVWKGKEFSNGYYKYSAKNEFLVIKLEGENIGKKPTFKSLRYVKLITKDGYEFAIKETIQISSEKERKEGYGGCIECELNPMEKAEEYVVFDIQKIDLAGAKLRFEDDLIDFEL